MVMEKSYNKTSLLVVGAGPAGLACALSAKRKDPELEICVIDKGFDPGNHTLSGALLEADAAHRLLDLIMGNRQDDEPAKDMFSNAVEHDDILFLFGRKFKFNVSLLIRLAGVFRLGIGNMRHDGDYIVSISKLTKWLWQEARKAGIEVLSGFSAEDIA